MLRTPRRLIALGSAVAMLLATIVTGRSAAGQTLPNQPVAPSQASALFLPQIANVQRIQGQVDATATPLPAATSVPGQTATPTTETPTATPTATSQLPIDTPTPTPTSTQVLPVDTPTSTPTATPTDTPTATPTQVQSQVVPTATPTATPTPTATINPAEEILIPAGTFQMGCDATNPAETCNPSEQPLHSVTLNAFFIDKYEVTNARYKACVDAGRCKLPENLNSATHAPYYGVPAFADYPVIRVTWTEARDFCERQGKRLPTEAEWERVARGNTDTRVYPWANATPDCLKLNYAGPAGACVGDTARIGSYPAGASPDGAMDMAGNVWEWVNDWHQVDYYTVSPASNPQGPATGTERAVRGGSFLYPNGFVRTAYRDHDLPFIADNDTGFRCARTP